MEMCKIDTMHMDIIKEKLKDRIAEKLNKAGIYYRMISRVKTEKSLQEKLDSGKYEKSGRHIQDLIGLRINLFYYEDIVICEDILNDTFHLDNWSKSDIQENIFHAQKRNGVFKIPYKYLEDVNETMWEYPIDKTFEVQIRTILFEGWHEIEHDMRYKDVMNHRTCLWEGHDNLSRLMNSIIANLEMCDWTMVEIFNQLAEAHLEDGNWELAIRSRYRLKITEDGLLPEVKKMFDENPALISEYLKVSKEQLVKLLLQQEYATQLTPNRIIYLIEKHLHINEEIHQLLKNDRKKVENREYQLPKLERMHEHPIFVWNVELDNSEKDFKKASQIIYEWACARFLSVFPEMPIDVSTLHKRATGYYFNVEYDESIMYYHMDLQHISNTAIGEIWNCEVTIAKRGKHCLLSAKTVCSSVVEDLHPFSRPMYVSKLLEQTTLKDAGVLLQGDFDSTKSLYHFSKWEDVQKIIDKKKRKLPIVTIFAYDNDEEGENCIIKANNFARVLRGIAHVFIVSQGCGQELEKASGYKEGRLDGAVAVWYPGEDENRIYTAEDIHACSFDENMITQEKTTEYERAFRQKLAGIIKRKNVES